MENRESLIKTRIAQIMTRIYTDKRSMSYWATVLLFVPVFVSAYSPDTTHRALTDEAVDFYNAVFMQSPLSANDKELIKAGSAEEDTPVDRVLNHFYDPVYNQGLRGISPSSKTWALDTQLQDNRKHFAGAGVLLFEYFGGGADYS